MLEAHSARCCHSLESTLSGCTGGTRLAPKLIFLKIDVPSDLVGRTSCQANRSILVEGDLLLVRLPRSRTPGEA